jgi:tripartite-type tricarboxylate transporter receptor subunit TctC
LADVLRQSDVSDRLLADGAEIADTTPAQFRAFVASEMKKWADLVRLTGITPE